jgi:hypothetical protein
MPKNLAQFPPLSSDLPDPAYLLATDPVLKLVCCWCRIPHVLREGAEPASHGMCEIAIQQFEAGVQP